MRSRTWSPRLGAGHGVNNPTLGKQQLVTETAAALPTRTWGPIETLAKLAYNDTQWLNYPFLQEQICTLEWSHPYANKQTAKSIVEWESISDRLISSRFASRYCILNILQCYAPTIKAEEEDKDDCYDHLQHAVFKVSQHNMPLITKDKNAKVGNDNNRKEDAMGQCTCGTIKDSKGIT